jgi:hypothetical protein
MQKKTKKILLFTNFALIIAFFSVIFIYVYFSLTDNLTNKLITEKPMNFSITLYGTENFMPNSLETFYVKYERKTKLIKILSVNTDTVVFRKKAKARSLKYSFFDTAKNDLNLALTNFYHDVFEMTNNSFTPDFYVTASYESLAKFFKNDEFLKKLISTDEFENRDLQCVNQLELAQWVLDTFRKNAFSNIKNIRKNYALLDTSISKLSFANMILYFKFSKAGILFFDLPAKYTKSRVEPDRDNVIDMLYTVYYPSANTEVTKRGGIVEVKNASGKPRMAEKAAWKLRENKIDVLEWSNFKTRYDKTLIKSYKGSYADALKAVEALGCGTILISYNNRTYYEMSVFVGGDCEIYDKLDKRKEKGN